MSKMLRNILIMVGVIAIAVVAFIFIPKLQPKQVETSPEPTFDYQAHTFSEYSADDVSEVTLEHDGVTTIIFFDKADDKYKVKGYEDVEINQSTAKNIFYTASYVEAQAIVAEDLSNKAEYGLDNPQAKVTAKYNDGKTNVFYFGNNAPGGGTYYMNMEGVDKVLNMWNNYGNNAKVKINDLRLIPTTEFELNQMNVIRLLKDDEVYMEFASNTGVNAIGLSSWSLTKPYKRELNTEEDGKSFYTLVKKALVIKPTRVLSAEGDFTKYGLEKPWGALELEPIKGDMVGIQFGNTIDGYIAMKYTDSDVIYGITESNLDFFEYKTIDVIQRLLTLVGVKNVTSVELSGVAGNNNVIEILNVERKDDEGNAKLDANGNPVFDSLYKVEGKVLGEEDGRDKQGSWFYQAILKPSIVREVEDENFDPGEMVGSIKWNLNIDPKEYIIEIYNYDEYFYAVKDQDNEVYLLVNKNDIDVLQEYYELLKKGEMVDPFSR